MRGLGASRGLPVAEGGHGAVVLVFALHVVQFRRESTRFVATGAFRGGALGPGFSGTPLGLSLLGRQKGALAGVAALLLALLVVEPAVALLALFHDLVAAERAVRGLEAVGLSAVGNSVEDGGNIGLEKKGCVSFEMNVPIQRQIWHCCKQKLIL